MSKQIEFNVEYSPKHELASEKAIAKPGSFEITSESIRTVQNVGGFFVSSHRRVVQVDRRSRCRDSSNVSEFLDRVVSSTADENHRDRSPSVLHCSEEKYQRCINLRTSLPNLRLVITEICTHLHDSFLATACSETRAIETIHAIIVQFIS